MKKTLLFSILLLVCHGSIGQNDFRVSDEIEKSSSITEVQMVDFGLENDIVFWMRQGATLFNQKDYLVKVDRKTLNIKDKVLLEKDPSIKGVFGNSVITSSQHLYLPYMDINYKKNTLDMYCYKLGDDLSTDSSPTKCFSGAAPEGTSAMKVSQNEDKDLILFNYEEKVPNIYSNTANTNANANEKRMDVFHCFILDENLNELYSKSYEKPHRAKQLNESFLLYNDGVIFVDARDLSTIHVVDVRNSKQYKFKKERSKALCIGAVKQLKNGNILISGLITSNYKNKTNGIFIAEINIKTEEIVYFKEIEEIEIEGLEKTNHPRVLYPDELLLSAEGNTYFLSYDINSFSKEKYYIHFFSNDDVTWSKALPIPNQILPNPSPAQNHKMRFFEDDNEVYLIYNDSKKSAFVDPNNFTFDSKIGSVNLLKTNGLFSVLKINSAGTIKRKTYTIDSKEFITGKFCISNKSLFSACRKSKGPVYSKSRVFEFDYSNF